MTKSTEQSLGPVTLPAGSYDRDALDQAIKTSLTAKHKDDDREMVASGLVDELRRQSPGGESREGALLPGYQVVERKHGEIDGLVEQVHAYDPKQAEAAEESQAGVATGDQHSAEPAAKHEGK